MLTPVTRKFRTAADFSMVTRLLQNSRYKIPEHLRSIIVESAAKIMVNGESEKAQLAAMRTLLKADEINLQLVKIAMPKRVENVNVKQLTDEELIDVVRQGQALLPAE